MTETNVTQLIEVAASEAVIKFLSSGDRDLLREIQKWIKNPPTNSRVRTISPALAKYLLDRYNLRNRSATPSKIATYAHHLTEGSWFVTGDTIKFSDLEIIMDGQKRLMACVKSGVSITSHFVFGIPDESFPYQVEGEKRDAGHILGLAGYVNARDVASGMRVLMRLEDGKPMDRGVPLPNEILDRAVQSLDDNIDTAVAHGRAARKCRGYINSQVAGLFLFVWEHGTAQAKVRMIDFADDLGYSVHNGRAKAISQNAKLMSELKLKTNGRLNDIVQFAMLINAWNLWNKNNKGHKKDHYWNIGDDFPTIWGVE